MRLGRQDQIRALEAGASRFAESERRRRARVDQAASAGLPQDRVDLEALYLIPQEFLELYVQVFHRALRGQGLRSQGGGDGAALDDPKAKSQSRKEMRGRARRQTESQGSEDPGKGLRRERLAGSSDRRARPSGRVHRDHWVVADERALAAKTAADKELRRLARDLEDHLKGGGSASGGVCPGCGRFLGRRWRHCAWCGLGLERKD